MTYPDNCIKGIPNDDCLETFGDSVVANVKLFCFPKDPCRPDGWIEESVNWMDDEKALPFTLRQTRDSEETKDSEELQFKAGVAILPRAELDRLKKRYYGLLDYERAPLETNSYHGNVLLKGSFPKLLRTQMRALLAHAAQVIRRDDSE